MNDYLDEQLYFQFEIGLILINLNQIFPIKPSKFEIFLSIKNFNKKTADNF